MAMAARSTPSAMRLRRRDTGWNPRPADIDGRRHPGVGHGAAPVNVPAARAIADPSTRNGPNGIVRMRPTMPMVAASPAARVRPATASCQSTEPIGRAEDDGCLDVTESHRRGRHEVQHEDRAGHDSGAQEHGGQVDGTAEHPRRPGGGREDAGGERDPPVGEATLTDVDDGCRRHRRDGDVPPLAAMRHRPRATAIETGRDGHREVPPARTARRTARPGSATIGQPPDRELVLKPPTASPSPATWNAKCPDSSAPRKLRFCRSPQPCSGPRKPGCGTPNLSPGRGSERSTRGSS